jgi:hypothetical protein
MMSFFPGSTHPPRGRRDAGQPAVTQALPAADPPDLQAPGLQGWPPDTQRDDDGGTDSPAVGAAPEGETASDHGEHGEPLPVPADEEPFVPQSRYVMGRSTKVLACILLIAAGVFAGSAIQKQIDTGTRGARTNFSNFQGTGTGTGAGTGTAGTQGPGQSRRGGGSGTSTTAPSAAPGQ